MSGREAFGPNLRRLRIQRGLTLEQIARETKVSVELWTGLERNDFARWPSGIFARAHIRHYARLIGADPEAAVDEFCRWFQQGDRRVRRVASEQAQIVGHDLQWCDDPRSGGSDADRRSLLPRRADDDKGRAPHDTPRPGRATEPPVRDRSRPSGGNTRSDKLAATVLSRVRLFLRLRATGKA